MPLDAHSRSYGKPLVGRAGLRFAVAMTRVPYSRLVRSLPASVPFVGPETQERNRGAPFVARLGANESVFGPSPAAVRAIAEATDDAWMYGDPENHDLRTALARHHGVRPGNVVVGEGIDGLLGYLVRLLTDPGDAIVTSDGAYPTFNYHVAGYGGILHKVPYRDDREDISALFGTAGEVGAKLVYLSNPDNPMGTWYSGAEILESLARLPPDCLLVLDEAYVECAPNGTVVPANVDDLRIIRMRTFSKVYGLAGLRVGYALGAEETIGSFNRIRNHFGVGRVAQAGALAALGDRDWLTKVRADIVRARDRIKFIAMESGLVPIPSAANFVALDCGADGVFAKSVVDALAARGVFVRMPFAAPQNRCIRVSCGRDGDLGVLAEALPKALREARG